MRFLAAGDLHYDDIPDGERRLELLTEEIGRQKPDFVVFLGDLCSPKEENRHLTDRLRGTGVPIHFVLGNHDLREGREQALRFFGKEKGYEAFLCGSIAAYCSIPTDPRRKTGSRWNGCAVFCKRERNRSASFPTTASSMNLPAAAQRIVCASEACCKHAAHCSV